MPNVDFPTITVTTRLPGAAPEQVESEITDKVEEAVNTISGIDQLNSNSAEGISQVIVTFRLEKNADVAAQEVRDRVNRILPLLPRTITQPTIEKQDPDAQPILTMALTADKPIRDVTEYADKVLRRRLESADGVGQVLVLGGRKRQINVWLDAERLRAYNLTVNDVARALQSQNADIPGGRIERGAQSITMRTRGRVETPEQFGDIVRPRGGRPSGARQRRRPRRRRRGRGDDAGQPQRRADGAAADPQAVGHEHRGGRQQRQGAAGGLQAGAAARATQLRIVRDQSEFIEASIRSVAGAPHRRLAAGRARGAAVPRQPPLDDHRRHLDSDLDHRDVRAALVHGLHAQHADDAGADAFGRHRHRRRDRRAREHLPVHRGEGHAADAGGDRRRRKEIGLAVMATTLSLVAIFVPVGFMSGMVGRFMQSFGLTMAFAVMVSLLVSFTLTPMMCARWLKVKPRTEDEEHHVHDSKHSKIFGPLDRVYTRMLEWSMAHRGIVAALAVLVLFSSVPLFRIVNVNFTPQDDQSEFDVSLRAPEGTSLEATEVMANRCRRPSDGSPKWSTRWSPWPAIGRHAEHGVAVT